MLDLTVWKDGPSRTFMSPRRPDRVLAESAIKAVRTWRYRPYLLNGDPVAVDTTVNVTYNLRAELATCRRTLQTRLPAGANGSGGTCTSLISRWRFKTGIVSFVVAKFAMLTSICYPGNRTFHSQNDTRKATVAVASLMLLIPMLDEFSVKCFTRRI